MSYRVAGQLPWCKGGNRYRHDSVLRVVAHHIALLIKEVNGRFGEWVNFVVIVV